MTRNMQTKSEIHFIGITEKAGEQEAEIRIFPEYYPALKGLEQFSHLIVLYWFHLRDSKNEKQTLLVFPKRHAVNVETGVFACRSPSRPNPIGLCVVELLRIDECTLTVKGLDAEEGSPVVDIKPYQPKADSRPDARTPQWTERGPAT